MIMSISELIEPKGVFLHHPPYTANDDFNDDELDNDNRGVRYPTVPEYEYFCRTGSYMESRDNRLWTYDPSIYSRPQVSTSSRPTDT